MINGTLGHEGRSMLYIIDSSAVINDVGFDFNPKNTYVTTPLVFNEFRGVRTRNLAENALHNEILRIEDPSEDSLNTVRKKIANAGFDKISQPDISLIALALDHRQKKKSEKFEVITDDYSIQNFLALLKIKFSSVVQGRIGRVVKLSPRCPACSARFPADFKGLECPVCGTKLRKSMIDH